MAFDKSDQERIFQHFNEDWQLKTALGSVPDSIERTIIIYEVTILLIIASAYQICLPAPSGVYFPWMYSYSLLDRCQGGNP